MILTLLLCALGFFIYLTDRNKNEVLRLKQELRDRDILIEELRRQLAAKSSPSNRALPPPSSETFVRVIFNKGDEKQYNYLVGELRDINLGDFVVVNVNDRVAGKTKWKIAQVVYISKPGEVSEFAKSAVVKKADYPKW